MVIINPIDTTFLRLIKPKQNVGDVYCPSHFVIRLDVPEGVLLYHTLSCEMVFLDNLGENIAADPYLREHMFFVPERMDEKKLVSQYRTIRSLVDKKDNPSVPTSYTIMTTTDCNARCFYCYEKNRRRIPMSNTTAMKVAEMAIRNFKKLSSNTDSEVKLRWFGGEPLFNAGAINIICGKLKENGVPYKSSMISNGYLFDEEIVRKAVELWKLKSVQITIDGTEDVYNRSKSFIYKDGSPYQRVIRNIGLLLDSKIKVTIRLNLGTHNAEDLLSLAHTLADNFGGKEGLNCYSHTLFEIAGGKGSVTLSDEDRKLLYHKQEQLVALLKQLGISKAGKLKKEIPFNQCMADSGKSLMIAPTGDIGLCEHYSESNFISLVDSDNIVDQEMVDRFKERREEIELCDKCPIYPQCIRLKMCEESSVCYPEIVEQKISEIKYAMFHEYEKYRGKLLRDDTPDFDDINC